VESLNRKTMDAKELRIGNFVHASIKSGKGRTVIHTITAINISNIDCGIGSFNFEPIPLTEEWLLKFGFIYRGIYYHFPNHDIFKLEQYKNKNAYWLRYYNEDIDCVRINYVHQLQNLYFALTNTELTLK